MAMQSLNILNPKQWQGRKTTFICQQCGFVASQGAFLNRKKFYQALFSQMTFLVNFFNMKESHIRNTHLKPINFYIAKRTIKNNIQHVTDPLLTAR
ncbi:hypothetical protein BJB45_18515 [Halomonas huangheensis]|uniref:Uncharacterized protein n=1 Tax=Halomonas huangheensis TaxID=1178482 RepID=W1ND67_9GAMM|nr:hypothetical protein AR456_11420 [Halomonas huangheensis]ERL53266.1 hypothetical protein BJB45_18515 [Halomonas huangheensis]